jgi:TrmH family RNA methyltransferase
MSNALRSTVRDLRRRRARRRRHLTLAEGIRLVEEALRAGAAIQGTVTAPMLQASPRGQALKRSLERLDVPALEVTDDELIELADTEHPQGVMVVVEPPTHRMEDIPVEEGHPVLVLDGVQDPGNVGALCRAALGLGASGVVGLPGTAELFGPKALRGSMGALFHLPALRCEAEAFLAWAAESDVELWLAATDGAPVRQVEAGGRRLALVLGNEGAGVRPELLERVAQRIAIPLAPGVESLNVAVAAGILLYEVVHGP